MKASEALWCRGLPSGQRLIGQKILKRWIVQLASLPVQLRPDSDLTLGIEQ